MNKECHVHIKFPDLEGFVREVRDSLLKETGQLSFPKDCEFRVHPEDVNIHECPEGNGVHIEVIMKTTTSGGGNYEIN